MIKKSIHNYLKKNLPNYQESLLSTPPDLKLGDFALPCFFLAKERKQKPNEIAEALVSELPKDDSIQEIKAVGPYLNIFINRTHAAKVILQEINNNPEHFGKTEAEKHHLMIEYLSPNVNKPLHLGHIRNAFMGMALKHMKASQGNKVTTTAIFNDRGMGVSQAMLGYKLFGENKMPDCKADHFVGQFYVKFKQAEKDDESLKELARETLLKFEAEDPDTMALWNDTQTWVKQGYEETFEDLGCEFDSITLESDIYKDGKAVAEEGLEKGVFTKDEDGNIIADLEEYNLGKKVVLRADGTAVYITQDLVLADLRAKEKLDALYYVVGTEHNLYFQQLFKIFELLKLPYANNLKHVAYELVYLPEGRMKSREGTVVDADDLVEQNTTFAKVEVQKRYKELSDDEVLTRAKIIGMAGLKFSILKVDPNRTIQFNPKESISFEGETGPYVLYAYARIKSILSKPEAIDAMKSTKVNFETIQPNEQEHALLTLLANFPEIVSKATADLKPSSITRFLLDLAQLFNEYYHATPILKEEDQENRAFKLTLIGAIAQTVKNGLGLLNIQTVEQM